MKNQNILCCIDENPIFMYSPILKEENKTLEQVIINYITKDFRGKRIIRMEKETSSNVEFIYYEINLEKAILKLMQRKKKRFSSIERFCLSFLNYFLEDTPKKLLEFLKRNQIFDDSELKNIEKEFNNSRQKSKQKSKK